MGGESVTILIGEKLTSGPDRFDRVTCLCDVVHEVRISDYVIEDEANPYGPTVHHGVRRTDCPCGLVLELFLLGDEGSEWEVKG